MHFTLGEQLFDLAENSVQAGARRVEVRWEERSGVDTDGWVLLEVRDDGRGMDRSQLERATDPFYTDGRKHPGRSVGLGLAFLRQTTEALGGRLEVDSEPGRGTTVRVELPAGNVDLPPAGDPVEIVGMLLCLEPQAGELEVIVRRGAPGGEYTVSRGELEAVIGELSDVGGRSLLREYLKSQEDEIWQR